MIYRGLGSGIVRVMKEGVRVSFVNEESANQFRSIVWRTTQKSKTTTQKDDFTIPKRDKSTTQKSETTTQKELTTTQKAVLDYFKNHPKGNRAEAALYIGEITEDGIKFIIGKLQQLGLLRREGGRKNGTWVVIEK